MATSYASPNPESPSRGTPWRIIIPVAGVALIVVALIVLNLNAIWGGISNALGYMFDYDSRMNPSQVVYCREDSTCSTVQAIVFSLVLFFTVLTGFAYTTLLERVLLARLQHRSGPNRVGPKGLLQPAADGVKLIFKEDITPAEAYGFIWRIAPLIKVVPVLIVMAVIPFGPDLMIPWGDVVYRVPLSLADPNVGVLWLLAITSIGTYGVALAGWSSNNKYAMLGSLRGTAQMLSYELSLGLTMIVPIVIAGSMSLGDIVQGQQFVWEWYVFQNPLAFIILYISLLAEINRAPFDLPEAEQELTAGYMTEYSGMKFASFMMAEYLGMIGVSLIMASLYLGGFQDGFGLVNSIPALGPLVLIGKVVLLLMSIIWVRATLPRIRYDRLMSFGWKVLIPLSLVSVAWTAIAVTIGDLSGSPVVYGIAAAIFFVVVLVAGSAIVRRSGEVDTEVEDDLLTDPIVTGERRGAGWLVLQVVGGLVAIPFALWNFTLNLLDGLAAHAPEDVVEAPAADVNDAEAVEGDAASVEETPVGE